MKKVPSGRFLFSVLYTVVLLMFTAYVLLDTFVIPRGVTVLPPSSGSASVQRPSGNGGGSSSVSSDPFASDGEGGQTSDVTDGGETEEDGWEAGSKPQEPQITDYSYRDENISITITAVREYNTDIYVADVILSSPEYLKTALAKNTYGRNIKEKTSEIAERVGAILAVNGDFYGYRNEGYVIRNGILLRETRFSSSREDLVIDEEGVMYGIREGEISAVSLFNAGAQQVLSFGPILVQDSEVSVDRSDEFGGWQSNPRCAVGMLEPLHYVFVVSDGRTRQSEGLYLEELANFMLDLGCTFAYNLDGGGSATMVFNGRVINNPTDGNSVGERKVSDIVCIGY